MHKMNKRLFALLLVLAMVVSAIAASAGATPEVTKPVCTDTAPLTLNTQFQTQITEPDSRVLFSFAPETDGYYIFASYSDQDTNCILYDAQMSYMDDNDDGGTEANFSLGADLAAGQTYYYSVGFYDADATGTFPVELTESPVESVTVEPLSIPAYSSGIESVTVDPILVAEGVDGSDYDGGYYYSWWDELTYTVTFADGTVIRGMGDYFDLDGKYVQVYHADTQYDDGPWQVGNANFYSTDGVVYNKAKTKLIFFPYAKTDSHKIPDTVTDIEVLVAGGPA